MKKVEENENTIPQRRDFAKICRCCLGMDPMTSIFELKFEETLFFEILQCLFCSEIKVDDDLPKNICQQCVEKVVQCYSFKRSYDMAEAILLGILEKIEEKGQNENVEISEIKSEIVSKENCVRVKEDIDFYQNIVESQTKEKGEVIASIIIDDYEGKEQLSLHTEIKLEDTTDQNLNNPVNSGDFPKTNQIVYIIPNSENNDENINNPIASDDLLQQSQIVAIPNPETGIKKKNDPLKRKSVNANNKDGESSKMITCSCLEVFATQSEYYVHRKKKKQLHRIKYPCEICQKCFPSDRLLIHMHSHTKEKPFKCELCPKSFTDGNNFRKHKRIHTGEKPYKCEHCGKAFTQSTTLVCHRRIHTKEKPYLCAICGARFGNPTLFYIHNRKHKTEGTNPVKTPSQHDDSQNFLCSVCDKEFPSKHSLSIHMGQHKKNNERTYLCNYCGKSFFTNGTLQQHSYIHTGERPYSCTFCNKTFKQATTLKEHTYTHTGEKPYICQVCQRGFSQRQQLKTHFRIHSGEKPYKCNTCKKAFAHKTTYDVHIRTHTGEKPYVCDGCQKGFYHSSTMKKHQKQYCRGVPDKAT